VMNPEKKKRLMAMQNNKTVFPSPHTIYEKEIVTEKYFSSDKNSNDSRKNSTCETGNSIRNKLFSGKQNSRFDFARKNNRKISKTSECNSTIDDSVEIPLFINDLIYKKFSRYSFFKKIIKDDEDLTYFDKNLIREYSESNPWACFIMSNIKDRGFFESKIEKLVDREKILTINKFNSA
jgi:hypothetical protein